MSIKNLLALILFIALISPCSADEVELHLASYHFDENRDDDFDEFNYGAGYNYQYNEDIYLILGAFNNSYGKGSVYAGGKWLPIEYKFFKAGVVGGVVTGYDDDTDANEVQPVILPEVQLHYKQFYLVSRYAPDFGGDNTSAAITFSIGYIFPE